MVRVLREGPWTRQPGRTSRLGRTRRAGYGLFDEKIIPRRPAATAALLRKIQGVRLERREPLPTDPQRVRQKLRQLAEVFPGSRMIKD